jgi:hypothetical protein
MNKKPLIRLIKPGEWFFDRGPLYKPQWQCGTNLADVAPGYTPLHAFCRWQLGVQLGLRLAAETPAIEGPTE